MIISFEAASAAGARGHQTRLERAHPITRHVQGHVTDLRGHGLRGGAVARVRHPTAGRLTALVAQVRGLLGRQAALEHCFDHLREEATIPGRREPTSSVNLDS
jgi:hypothetical protein